MVILLVTITNGGIEKEFIGLGMALSAYEPSDGSGKQTKYDPP
jgi:hypothetical protein